MLMKTFFGPPYISSSDDIQMMISLFESASVKKPHISGVAPSEHGKNQEYGRINVRYFSLSRLECALRNGLSAMAIMGFIGTNGLDLNILGALTFLLS